MPRNTQLRCVQCCTCLAKRDFGAPSAAIATQNEAEGLHVLHLLRKRPEVLQVLRLPRKASLRCLQVLRVPRKTRRRPKGSLVAGLPPTSMKRRQVLRLLRKTSLRCSDYCTCHAKQGDAQKHHWSPDFRQTSMKVLQVLRLPRKTSLGCSNCCACYAKRAGGAPSAAPATQNEV